MNPDNPQALSRRFKSSFQTALAMVITYGLALSFDWDKPMWAAFAVALIGMPSVGATLGKGGERLFGSLLAAVVALLFVGLFAQDRWLFMLCLSTWLAVCTYMMSSGRYSYFWFCGGFVSAIIAMNAGLDAANAFPVAVARTLETSLGIVVYTLVVLFVWPETGTPEEVKGADGSQVFPDLDRLACAMRFFVTYWLGFLAVIYVPGWPGGMGFLAMLAPFAIISANAPQMPINTLYKPIGISIVLASFIYMLLMPKLTGFDELAIVIFLVTFLICYLFYQPQQAMGRSFGICLFFAVTAITNDQVYSFLAAANMGLMFALVLFLLVITAHFPVSNLPQKTFMRLLDRFIASAEFLAQHSRPHSLSARYQIAFHRYELSSLPGKLAAWKPRVPPDLLVSVQDELDVLLVQLGSAGEVLLQEETPDPQNPVDKLADDYAMIDLLPLREARF